MLDQTSKHGKLLVREKQIEILLKKLHLKIYKMTLGECNTECPKDHLPTRCCSDLMCQYVQEKLKLRGIKVAETGNEHARYMSDTGCVVPPQLRPVCSIYWCQSVKQRMAETDPEAFEQWQALKGQLDMLYNEFRKVKILLGKEDHIADLSF